LDCDEDDGGVRSGVHLSGCVVHGTGLDPRTIEPPIGKTMGGFSLPRRVGVPNIDARADLYSLGCVFYEILAGEPPFTGGAAHKVLMRTLTETPVPISERRDAVPADVGMTLDRLLAKQPAARFPDAAHVVDALSQIA
jgi:serine/threonine-protein kinase